MKAGLFNNTSKKSLACFLVLFSSLSLFAQTPYPGCPNISIAPVNTSIPFSNDTAKIPCGQSCIDLTASHLQTGATTKYKVSSIPYAPPFSFTGGTAVIVDLDDIYTEVINLPFNFCFFGSVFNKIAIGANGLITFDQSWATNTNCYLIDRPIPNTTNASCLITADGNGYLPWNSIYGAFHDLDPRQNGANINYSILGTAPCRTFVVNFSTVTIWGCALKTTQQIVIYETTNVIEVYIKSKPNGSNCSTGNGESCIGIQNNGGTLAYAPPGRNTGVWAATNEAWRFTPDGTPNYTINWFDRTGTNVGTGTNVSVCPGAFPERYIAEVTYTNCNGALVKDRDTITIANEIISGYANNDTTICQGDSANLTFTHTVAAVPGLTYTWSGGPTTNSALKDTKGIPTDSTQYIITVSSSSNPSCIFRDTVIVKVIKTNAGGDGIDSVCTTGNALNLTTKLVAPYDVTDTSWRDPSGNPFTNPLNPAIATAGSYLHIVKHGVCPADTAIVKISIGIPPDAGNNGVDTMCKTVTNGNLFNVITGEPTGGTWSGPSGTVNSTTGIVNVTTLTPANYIYQYVVKGAKRCPNDTAFATVNVKALPTASFPAVTPFCKGTTGYLKPVFTGTAPFSLTFSNGSSSTTVNNLFPGDSIAITPTASPTTYTITSLSDGGNYSCTNTATSSRVVTLLSPPQLTLDSLVCNNTNSGYQAFLTFSGGDAASYTLNGAPVSGTTHTSPVLPAGSTYTFVLSDKDGCTPVSTVTGVKNCNCSTDAGTMQTPVLNVCENGTATATHNTGTLALDGNDVLNYILHTNNGTSLGTIVSINTSSPVFVYNPNWGIQFEATYYISAVAGDEDPTVAGYVDLSNPNGCLSVSVGQPVVFHQNPLATAELSDTLICLGDSTNLKFKYQGGVTPFEFTLSDGTVIPGRDLTNNTHTLYPPALGDNTYTLTQVKEPNGCVSPLNISLTVKTVDYPLVVNFKTTCNSTNTAYKVSFDLVNGDFMTYKVDGNPCSGAFVSADITSGTNYSFAVSDTNHCKDTIVNVSVTCPCVSKAGTMTQTPASPVNEVCTYSTFTAVHNGDQVFDGNDVLSFILCTDPANAIGSKVDYKPTPTFSFNDTTMTTGTVYYICPVAGDIDPTNSMVDLASTCINVTPGTPLRFIASPTVSLSGDAVICANSSTPVTLTFTGNGTVNARLMGSDGFSKMLSGTAGTPTVESVQPNTGGASGTVTYSIDLSGANTVSDGTVPTACTGSWQGNPVTVVVHPIPTASLNNTASIICDGESIAIPVVTSGDGLLSTYLSYNNGIAFDSFVAQAGTTNLASPSWFASDTTYTFSIDSIRDNTPARCFAVGTGTQKITIRELPDIIDFYATPPIICSGSPTTLNLKASGFGTKKLYAKFATLPSWVGNDTTLVFSPTVTATTNIVFQCDSIFDGTVSAATGKACKTILADTVIVTINPLPIANISGGGNICEGFTTNLLFDYPVGTPPFNTFFTYDVNLGLDSIKPYSNNYSLTISPIAPFTYNYTLDSVIDANQCVASSLNGLASVTVFETPVVNFSASDTNNCPPLTTTLNNLTPAKFLGTSVWDLGNGTVTNDTNPATIVYNKAQSYNVSLTVTSPQGCINTESKPNFLTVYPFPTADFSWPTPVTLLDPLVRLTNTSAGDVYSWWAIYDSKGNLIDSSIVPNPSINFPSEDTGSYRIKLLVKTTYLCPDSMEQILKIEGIFEIYAPNTFTPNGDGVNDDFLPVLIGEQVTSYQLDIFNRWGQQIFHSTNKNQPWDGTFNGETAKADVYLYRVSVRSKYNAEKKVITGQLRLMK